MDCDAFHLSQFVIRYHTTAITVCSLYIIEVLNTALLMSTKILGTPPVFKE